MLRTTSAGTGGFDVETTTDLGTGRNEVPAAQHHNADLFLCREVLRSLVWVALTVRTTHYVAEKE